MIYETQSIIPPMLARPKTLVRRVEDYIEAHPDCTAREIADALPADIRRVNTTTSRLCNAGVIRRARIVGRQIQWVIGVEEGVTPKSERGGEPVQRILSEWEPVQMAKQSWLSALGIVIEQETACV